MGNAQRRATNTVSRQAQGFMSFARKIRKKKKVHYLFLLHFILTLLCNILLNVRTNGHISKRELNTGTICITHKKIIESFAELQSFIDIILNVIAKHKKK